jgi:hypothetical protein
LDFTVQIIYYAVLLQGIVLDPDAYSGNRGIIRNLYLKCVALSEDWLANIQDTPADLFAALSMVCMMRFQIQPNTNNSILHHDRSQWPWKAVTPIYPGRHLAKHAGYQKY